MTILKDTIKWIGKAIPKFLPQIGQWLGGKIRDKGFTGASEIAGILEDVSKSTNLEDLKRRGKHIITEQAKSGITKLTPIVQREIEKRTGKSFLGDEIRSGVQKYTPFIQQQLERGLQRGLDRV